MTKNSNLFLIGLSLIVLASACQSDGPVHEKPSYFELHEATKTGLDFSNDLPVSIDLNIFNYMYYYNGGGMASADFNNDGLLDVYFTSNLGEEKMYLNKGGLTFEDISSKTNIDAGQGGWTTGAAVVDINNDDLVDIYICQVGKYRTLDAKNKLLICTGIDDKGIPQYKESAEKYGLDFQGFSTQAGFFDYDLDGDLDMYLMNHSLHHNGTFGQRKIFTGTFDEVSGDRLYRNDNNTYVDVSKESGIESSVIGYGLGLAFGDVNLDGYPDIYIGNDFHENDYLYINQGDGTFKEDLTNQMMHTSRFSMGVDIADVNNDMQPDIISLDMLPEDPKILKMSEGEDAIGIFNFKLTYGYNYQYAKNCLQINNGNNSFSDVAMFSGVHATDWSWSPVFSDFNLDGKKDLFITNGIPRRMNDIDYINYIAGNEIQKKIQFDQLEERDLSAIDKIPEIKLRNKFYFSKGKLQFEDVGQSITNNKVSYSSSTIVADFDNDGDADVICNNINETAFLYENNAGDQSKAYSIQLEGLKQNKGALGSKVIVYAGGERQYFEATSTKGFQSSRLSNITFGTDDEKIDSINVIWPDGSYQNVADGLDSVILCSYKKGLPTFDLARLKKKPELNIENIASQLGVTHTHKENPFTEFHREPLIPQQTSDHGPALAVGDLNGDGLEDFFIGSSKFNEAALFYQNTSGKFIKQGKDILNLDEKFEEVDAAIVDVNQDGRNDLILATGGNEWRLGDPYTSPLLFVGNTQGKLIRKDDAFTDVSITAGGMDAGDFDGDGDIDLIISARAMPWTYGRTAPSCILYNNGQGVFTDLTESKAPDFKMLGLVKDVLSMDIDKDNDLDFVAALEWGGVYLFRNQDEKFEKEILTDRKGWWNFIEKADYDQDGDLDLILGNLGQNTRLKACSIEPLRMYVNDFDDNDKEEQIFTYYVQGREIPFSNMMELQKALPYIKDKYQYAKDFAVASPGDIMGKAKESSSHILEADYLDNAVLINNGGSYTLESMDPNLQLTPYNDALAGDFDGNGTDDLIMLGNYYGSNIQMGRYDSDFGTYLLGGQGSMKKVDFSGERLIGQGRSVEKIQVGSQQLYLVGMNDEALRILKISAVK